VGINREQEIQETLDLYTQQDRILRLEEDRLRYMFDNRFQRRQQLLQRELEQMYDKRHRTGGKKAVFGKKSKKSKKSKRCRY
jgi:hypothetical protein